MAAGPASTPRATLATFAWSIRAWRWITGPIGHRINHEARINHNLVSSWCGEVIVQSGVSAMTEAELRAAVEAWIADDPDAGDRAELQGLLERAFWGSGG